MKVGDVVLLKSGSPKMTVTYVLGAGAPFEKSLKVHNGLSVGDVVVEWFDNNGTLQKGFFKKESLSIDGE